MNRDKEKENKRLDNIFSDLYISVDALKDDLDSIRSSFIGYKNGDVHPVDFRHLVESFSNDLDYYVRITLNRLNHLDRCKEKL